MELPKLTEVVKDVTNITRCFGELAVLYTQEKVRDFQAMLDDAEDVWGVE